MHLRLQHGMRSLKSHVAHQLVVDDSRAVHNEADIKNKYKDLVTAYSNHSVLYEWYRAVEFDSLQTSRG